MIISFKTREIEVLLECISTELGNEKISLKSNNRFFKDYAQTIFDILEKIEKLDDLSFESREQAREYKESLNNE